MPASGNVRWETAVENQIRLSRVILLHGALVVQLQSALHRCDVITNKTSLVY